MVLRTLTRVDEAGMTSAASQEMHRSALLPTSQAQILATLSGHELREVGTDGWSVWAVVGDQRIHFVPREVRYEEDDPILDVDRIELEIATEEAPKNPALGKDLGRIERVFLVRTLTAYLPPEHHPAREATFGGKTVKIPAGEGYRAVNVAPSGLKPLLARAANLRELHFMPVDIGVVIATAGHRVLVNTCGYFVEASVDADDHSGQIRDSDLIQVPGDVANSPK
jgi:hypothetical protein